MQLTRLGTLSRRSQDKTRSSSSILIACCAKAQLQCDSVHFCQTALNLERDQVREQET